MFNEYTDLKSALGLSSRSITHRWNETGISDIEGYATHIEKLAKYVKWMETAGKIGIGLSAFDTAAKITEACTVGRDCAKTSFTSIGEFAGSLAGGLWQVEFSREVQQVQSVQSCWVLQPLKLLVLEHYFVRLGLVGG